MSDSVGEIIRVDVGGEFRVCPACGYERGFHISFRTTEAGLGVVLICPNCGARYDVGDALARAIGHQNVHD